MNTTAKIAEAYNAGRAAAAKMMPGMMFVPAVPAARAAGYQDGSIEFDAFVEGYAKSLRPGGIEVDDRGLVVG